MKTIPAGVVATYGQVAAIVGCSPRLVGYALASLPAGMDVPWQRVINAKGRISNGGQLARPELQRQLLQQEGVEFAPDGEIELARFQWCP